VSNIWTISCDDSETVRNWMPLCDMPVLITNRKSHRPTGFRLIPTSMTLNDLEQRNSLFAFFTNLVTSLANYVTVVEDRPIMSVKYCLPVPSSTFTHPAVRSLCDSWATCSNLLKTTNGSKTLQVAKTYSENVSSPESGIHGTGNTVWQNISIHRACHYVDYRYFY